jgi:uncharacterized membrane protein
MDQAASPVEPVPAARRRRFRLFPGLRALLRTRILAGLLTVIPIWVTYVIVRWIFDMMRGATQPLADRVAKSILEANKSILPTTVQDYVEWIVPLVAVLLTLFILYLLGLLTANVFGRRIIVLFERMFTKLPLVKTIYTSTKQIVMTLGGAESMHFQRVVLVEFPHPGMKCIAFLTSVMDDADTGRKMANVFISTTPNPTTGYMQIVPLDRVSETTWTMEEAVKLLMSGGIVSPPAVNFDKIHPVRWPPESKPAEDGAKPARIRKR